MTPEQLHQLLNQSETAYLDFKRKFKLYHEDGSHNHLEKDELIKDILALANGNEYIASRDKHLIYGADDRRQPDTPRQLYNVDTKTPDRTTLLNMINAACRPNLTDINCETITLDQHGLFVITIPPTPHLHEITRHLKTPHTVFHENTVFMRRHETTGCASTQEREAILRAKRQHFKNNRKVNPIWFGIFNNAVLLGSMAWGQMQDAPNTTLSTKIIIALIIAVIGALTGLALGLAIQEFNDIRNQWPRLSKRKQFGYVLYLCVIFIFAAVSIIKS